MLRVAGVGPGNINNMTVEVYEEIKKASKVIAFGRVGKSIEELRKDIVVVKTVSEVLENIKDGVYTLLLASGDPCFYGITNYIKSNGIVIDKIYPGISSFQYLMAKLQMPWQEVNLFSLHGREYALEDIKNHKISVGLTDKENTPSSISKRLLEMGVKGKLVAAYNLSYPEEYIEERAIGEEFSNKSILAIVVIKNEMD